jgi:hypothetical protein
MGLFPFVRSLQRPKMRLVAGVFSIVNIDAASGVAPTLRQGAKRGALIFIGLSHETKVAAREPIALRYKEKT